ncbi:MAG: helix-turn-helix transcriptional regulator [Flavobacteriales bacterium]|nr:helix-turn-helix transcriptional regulator [Flavobacteriales bacterium]
MNTDESQIRRIENGQINTSIKHLFRLKNALQVSDKDLLDF